MKPETDWGKSLLLYLENHELKSMMDLQFVVHPLRTTTQKIISP